MAVTEQTPRNVSTATAGATVFPYTFKITDKSQLLVTVDGQVKIVDVDFTVSDVGSDSGGNVTMLVPLAGGETVLRKRNMRYERQTDYQNLGDLRSKTLNNDQDDPVMMIQQVAESDSRSLKVREDYDGPAIDTTLPDPEALSLLAWNTAGTALENYPSAQLFAGVSAGAPFQYQVTHGQTVLDTSNIPAPWMPQAVFYNGIYQAPSAYTLSTGGSAITFSEPLPVSGVVTVQAVYVDPEVPTDASQQTVTVAASGAVTRSARDKFADTISVKDFGAVGNGVTDDSVAFQRAIDYANSIGGARVLAQNAVYACGSTIVLKSNVDLDMAGGTLLRIGSGFHSLIKSEGFDANVGTDNDVGVVNAAIRNATLDGGYVVGTSDPAGAMDGCGIMYFGRRFTLSDVYVQNMRGIGIWTEYRGNQSPYGHRYVNVTVDGCGRSGWYHRASDAHALNVNIRSVARAGEADCDGLVLISFMRGENVNVWQPGAGTNVDNMRYAVNVDTGAAWLVNCTFEHGRDACLNVTTNCNSAVIIANLHTIRSASGVAALIRGRNGRYDLTAYPGTIFPNSTLIQLGLTGDSTTITRGNKISVAARDGTPASIVYAENSGGNNEINLSGSVASASGGVITGTLTPSDIVLGSVQGAGYFGTSNLPTNGQSALVSTSATTVDATLRMPNNTTWLCVGRVVARNVAGADEGRKAWEFSCVISRGATFADMALAGGAATVAVLHETASASTWTFGAVVNSSLGGLRFTFNGEASKTVNVVVDYRLIEVRQ